MKKLILAAMICAVAATGVSAGNGHIPHKNQHAKHWGKSRCKLHKFFAGQDHTWRRRCHNYQDGDGVVPWKSVNNNTRYHLTSEDYKLWKHKRFWKTEYPEWNWR